ncbi:hypothetical protein V6574_33475 [Streptomyces sp. SM1P]
MGSTVLSSLQLGWVPAAQSSILLLLVLIFVVPLQLVGGVFAFLARDAGAGTALLLLGAAWAGTSVTSLDSPPGKPVVAQAVFLLALVPFVLALAGAAVQSKPLFAVLLTLTAVRFALTGLYEADLGTFFQTAAGWTGLGIGVFALYGGLALLVEDSKQRTVLPSSAAARPASPSRATSASSSPRHSRRPESATSCDGPGRPFSVSRSSQRTVRSHQRSSSTRSWPTASRAAPDAAR